MKSRILLIVPLTGLAVAAPFEGLAEPGVGLSSRAETDIWAERENNPEFRGCAPEGLAKQGCVRALFHSQRSIKQFRKTCMTSGANPLMISMLTFPENVFPNGPDCGEVKQEFGMDFLLVPQKYYAPICNECINKPAEQPLMTPAQEQPRQQTALPPTSQGDAGAGDVSDRQQVEGSGEGGADAAPNTSKWLSHHDQCRQHKDKKYLECRLQLQGTSAAKPECLDKAFTTYRFFYSSGLNFGTAMKDGLAAYRKECNEKYVPEEEGEQEPHLFTEENAAYLEAFESCEGQNPKADGTWADQTKAIVQCLAEGRNPGVTDQCLKSVQDATKNCQVVRFQCVMNGLNGPGKKECVA